MKKFINTLVPIFGIFLLSMVLSVIIFPLRVNWPSNDVLSYIIGPVGYASFYFYFTWLICRWKGRKINLWIIALAITVGSLVIDLPVHITDWDATHGSFPDVISRLLGTLFGFFFYSLKTTSSKWIAGIGFTLLLILFACIIRSCVLFIG